MIHAWVDNGLLYVVRVTEGVPGPQHALFLQDSVIWFNNGPQGEVQPLLDLEKSQINSGRPWPPTDPPVSM